MNVLVICPATLKLNWKREFEKWSIKKIRVGIADTKICPLPEHGYNIVITNFEAVRKINNKLSSLVWDLLIIDEAHYLKNEKTVRCQSIFGNGERFKKIPRKKLICATGTPMPNRLIEMWPIISELDPEKWNESTKWRFISRYCGGTKNGHSNDARLNELQNILRSTIMVRRLKKDVLKELPPKVRQVIELDYDEDDGEIKSALNHEEVSKTLKDNDAVLEARVRMELAKALNIH